MKEDNPQSESKTHSEKLYLLKASIKYINSFPPTDNLSDLPTIQEAFITGAQWQQSNSQQQVVEVLKRKKAYYDNMIMNNNCTPDNEQLYMLLSGEMSELLREFTPLLLNN